MARKKKTRTVSDVIDDIRDLHDKEEDLLQELEDLSCLLYTSPSPRDRQKSRMPSSA